LVVVQKDLSLGYGNHPEYSTSIYKKSPRRIEIFADPDLPKHPRLAEASENKQHVSNPSPSLPPPLFFPTKT
jgi:hypothetical protein